MWITVDNEGGMVDAWNTVIEKIRSQISPSNYTAWFSGVRCESLTNSELTISVPSIFHRDWLCDYYQDTIAQEITKETGHPCAVAYHIRNDPEDKPEDLKIEPPTRSAAAPSEAPAVALEKPAALAKPAPPTTVVRAPIAEALNPKYTFDRFVTGNNNQFAGAASKAVAEMPGLRYNPLFIYGGVGLGKTHLLHAIGNDMLRIDPTLRVLYIGSERFMNEVITCIRHDKMTDFRKKYRDGCDVFLIDDIQCITGKERTQEEFFHTFNWLHEQQKQIVVTSDRFPKELHGFEDRLRSRFEWGLIADMTPPDLETRIAILQKKAELDHIVLADDVALYLAQRFRSNIRELEGALIRLAAYSSLNGNPMTVEFAQENLKHVSREAPTSCSIESIQKMVADYYQLKIADMKSARRMKHLAFPRQIAMYLCRKHIGSSLPEIGRKFGGKDHTTVMHACKRIEEAMLDNPRVRDEIAYLEKNLAN